jgi:hypothetical protein
LAMSRICRGMASPAGVIDCPAAFKGKPAYSRQTFLMIL